MASDDSTSEDEDERLLSEEGEESNPEDKLVGSLVDGDKWKGRVWVQKRCKYICKHPDPDTSEALLFEEWEKIKENLSLAVSRVDVRPGYIFWLERLATFLNLYGLHITLSDHVYMVKLLCAVATAPDVEPSVCNQTLSVLNEALLKGHYLKPGDLVVNWKPWYDLYRKYHVGYDSSRHIIIHQRNMYLQVAKTVLQLQKFFTESATQEILAEARKWLAPESLVYHSGIRVLYLFLPTQFCADVDCEKIFNLWFPEIMNIWQENLNLETEIEIDIIFLIRRLSQYNIGRIDWEPFLPKIYTRVLKYFALPLNLHRSVGVPAFNRLSTSDKSGKIVKALSEILVNTIEPGNSALAHLELLFKSLENCYHPSNLVGNNVSRLFYFMGYVLKRFLERVILEREERDKWTMCRQPEKSFLKQEIIDKFVQIVQPSVLFSVFVKARGGLTSLNALNADTSPVFFVQTLAILSPGPILNNLFDKLYTALSSLTEPHQLSASLVCVAYACPSIITEVEKFPGGRLKLLQLIPQLLPALDANDNLKLASATMLLSSIFLQTPLANCAQAGIHHPNLTEEEMELCHYTANLEVVLVEIIRKFISVLNSLRSTETFMEVSGTSGNNRGAIKSVGPVLLSSLSSCLTGLIYYSSAEIAKLLIQELFNYVSTTIINVNSGFGFLSKILTTPAITTHPDIAGALYVPHVHKKLKQLAVGQNLTSETEVDKEFLWYAAVFESFSGFLKGEYEEEIIDCIRLLLGANHKDIYRRACAVLQAILAARLGPSVEPTSRPASYSHLSLQQYVPILDFGKVKPFKELELDWKLVGKSDVSFAERTVEEFLLPCLEEIRNFTAALKKSETAYKNGKVETKPTHTSNGGGNILLSREQLLKKLTIVQCFIEGLSLTLRGLDAEHILRLSRSCDISPFEFNEQFLIKSFKYCDSLRKDIAIDMHELLNTMLSNDDQENDVKSLTVVSKLIRQLIMQVGGRTKMLSTFAQLKKWKNTLMGKKRFRQKKLLSDWLEVSEISLHYQMTRTYQRTPGKFGRMCEMLAHDIWKLATSRYPVVRSEAQQSLDMLLHVFKYSSRVFVPLIETTLLKPESYHQYKGALHAVMLSKNSTTMLEIHDFDVQSKLWIAVLRSYRDDSPAVTSSSSKESNDMSCPDENQELKSGHKVELLDKELSNESGLGVDSDMKMTSDVEEQGDLHSDTQDSNSTEEEGNFKKRKSVIALLQNLYSKVSNNCTTIAITTSFPDYVTEIPSEWLKAKGVTGETDEDKTWKAELEEENQQKFKVVQLLVEDLCDLAENPRIHNCVHVTAMHMLQFCCLRRDWPTSTPIRVIKVIFNSTLSESLVIRRCGYTLMRIILELNKVRSLKASKPLYELYNSSLESPVTKNQSSSLSEADLKQWIMYTQEVICDANMYDKRQFIDRNHYFYHATATTEIDEVYAPPSDQSAHFDKQSEHFTEVQNFMISWFRNDDNIARFVRHLGAEEKRVGVNPETNSKEKNDFCRFKIWQFVFRLFQDEAFQMFETHVKSVVEEKTDSSHRFLSEFCSGAIHASKLWNFSKIEKCKQFILPIFEKKLTKLDDNVCMLWASAFQHMIKDVDPMRLQWLLEWLFGKLAVAIYPDEFNRSGTLLASLINNLVVCFNFEANNIKERHMEFMIQFMSSRFTKYRRLACQSIASCTAFYNSQCEWAKSKNDVMDLFYLCTEKWMSVSTEVQDPNFKPPEPDKEFSAKSKSAMVLNKINSIALLLSSSLSFTSLNQSVWLCYQFLPALALMDGLDPDPDNVKTALNTVQKSAWAPMVQPKCLVELVPALEQMSSASSPWRSKRLCLIFMQHLALANIFLITPTVSSSTSTGKDVKQTPDVEGDKEKLMKCIRNIILRQLKDEKLEVRELASSTLSGYIHCGLIAVDKMLLRKLAKLRSSQLSKSSSASASSNSTTSDGSSNYNIALIERHAGVLGLKACVKAYPYSIPDWLPAVLMSLADHAYDPTPIEATVRDTFADFKRTHHDNWTEHKTRFSEDELTTLQDILTSPSYYV